MKSLYVAFDDSHTDPTYTSALNAYFVEGDSDADVNPCTEGQWVPVVPVTAEDLKMWAAVMHWTVSKDKDGNLVITTDIED